MSRLEAYDGKLYAIEDPTARHWVVERRCGDSPCWQLANALAFFIPEKVPDPSRQPAGEALWVEVTVPPRGPPRPIRLGVMKKGSLTPLQP